MLYARRVPGVRAALVETLGGMLGAVPGAARERVTGTGRWFSFLDRNSYRSLSYVNDWLDAFVKCDRLDVRAFNIVDLRNWVGLARHISAVPLVVVLHSAAGDDMSLVGRLVTILQGRRGKLLLFFGNEYDLMQEKIAFAKATGAELIASQLPPASAKWLYSDCPDAAILHAPAALNPRRFSPAGYERTIDIGFRGDLYPHFIGDNERTKILYWFRDHGPNMGLNVDIRFQRMASEQWVDFLRRCRGIAGAEAGTYYLEKDGRTARSVREYLKENPRAEFPEVYERFFDGCEPHHSGKAVSSRHFEAMGTKTCQILIEGGYNGLLERDVHYIAVKQDLSDIGDAVTRFSDPSERARVVEAAYQHAITHHTYDERVEDVLAHVL